MEKPYTPDGTRPLKRIDLGEWTASEGTIIRSLSAEHLHNAVTHLCRALNCSQDREEASRIISALTVAVAAKFGPEEKR